MLLSKKYGILIAMTGSFAMTMLDNSIVSIAMPYIQGDLDASKSLLIWIFNAYVLTFGTCVAICGRFGDVYGHLRMFISGILLFILSSAICGIAPNGESLVIARIFQAIGAAMMQPSSLTVVVHTFPLRERAKAIGIYTGIGLAFLGMGPIVGGFLTSFLSWRWIFYINIPIGLLALLMLKFYKPDQLAHTKTRIDRYGILLLILGLPLVTYAFQEANQWGLFSLPTLFLFGTGLFFLIWFFRHELKHPDPIIHVQIFFNRLFLVYCFILCFTTFALYSSSVFNSIFLQNVMGFQPYVAGIALLVMLIPNIIMGQISGRTYDKIGLKLLLVIGTALTTLSFLGLAAVLYLKELSLIIILYLTLGIGVGMTMTPIATEMMSFAAKEKTGQMSGLLQTLRLIGATIGIAIVSSVIFRHESKLLRPVMEKFGISEIHESVLMRLLSEPESEKYALAARLTNNPEALIERLTLVTAKGISHGFFVSSMILLCACLLSIIAYFMVRRRNRN